MSNSSHDLIRQAVDLARSGRCNNWWCVAARLRLKGYPLDDLPWAEWQRQWLDGLCAEARLAQGAAYSFEATVK